MFNPTPRRPLDGNIRWDPGRLSFHPGPRASTAWCGGPRPRTANTPSMPRFWRIDQGTTTDVHVLHAAGRCSTAGSTSTGRASGPAFDRQDHGRERRRGGLRRRVGGTAVLSAIRPAWRPACRVRSGKTFDAAKDFDAERQPRRPVELRLPDAGAVARRAARFAPTIGRAGSASGTRLLDLGNPAARQWLTDHVDKLLTEQGIDLYRQDFNMDPLEFWRRQRPARPAGHYRDQARDGLPGLLGRTPPPPSAHAHRLLRLGRAAQRPGNHAPRRAALAERLRLRADRPSRHDLRHLLLAAVSRHRDSGLRRRTLLWRRPDAGPALRLLEQHRALARQRDRRPRERHRLRGLAAAPGAMATSQRILLWRLLSADSLQPGQKGLDCLAIRLCRRRARA